MNKIHRGLVSFWLIIVIGVWTIQLPADDEEGIFFYETGHWVTGDFLKTYQSVHDPLVIFGYPITDSFIDPVSGNVIQYFQKARLVLDPSFPSELGVHRTPLGKLLYNPGTVLPYRPVSSGCQTFQETGYQVCYAFLDFFRSHGGVAQLGFPISNFEIQDGRIVQYFQRARLEWHPELPAGQRVVTGNLGMEYFRLVGEDPLLLHPALSNNIPQSILDLRVNAFVKHAVVPSRSAQTLYVVVQDQNFLPVAGAQVVFSLSHTSGDQKIHRMSETDKNGISQTSFSVEDSPFGLIQISVRASFDNLVRETRTSFRIWW